MNTGIVQFARYNGDNYPVALPFGIYERYHESFSDESTSTGTINNDFTVVPAGELWVIQKITYLAAIANVGSMWVGINDGTNVDYIHNDSTGTFGIVRVVLNPLILIEGEKIRFQVFSKASSSDVYCHVWGYKMKVDGS